MIARAQPCGKAQPCQCRWKRPSSAKRILEFGHLQGAKPLLRSGPSAKRTNSSSRGCPGAKRQAPPANGLQCRPDRASGPISFGRRRCLNPKQASFSTTQPGCRGICEGKMKEKMGPLARSDSVWGIADRGCLALRAWAPPANVIGPLRGQRGSRRPGHYFAAPRDWSFRGPWNKRKNYSFIWAWHTSLPLLRHPPDFKVDRIKNAVPIIYQ